MQKIIINGGALLEGEVNISGSKNSVVALIPAAILCNDIVRIYNYPKISDVKVLISILRKLNVRVIEKEEYLEIDSSNIEDTSLICEEVSKLRASYYFMGALLTLFKHVHITMPGGCDLGLRPIDLHVKGFEKLGSTVEINKGIIKMEAESLTGNKIFLDIASVGATINIMLASIFAKGDTVIENAAKEPEVADVAKFLKKMGANITGEGTSVIKITGVKKLNGTTHTVIPDRIETGTYLLCGAAIGKEVIINEAEPKHLQAVLSKLNECNVNVKVEHNKIIVKKTSKLKSVNIRTAVYPGFPTDLQQIFTTLMTQADGTSIINERIYTQRFKNCKDLIKMGANIRVENTSAVIIGPTPLIGTNVEATDLRGGASLLVAGLIASNHTVISEVEHIFRGYNNIIGNLKGLNADIKLIEN